MGNLGGHIPAEARFTYELGDLIAEVAGFYSNGDEGNFHAAFGIAQVKSDVVIKSMGSTLPWSWPQTAVAAAN